MKRLILCLLCLVASVSYAQTPVVLAPVPQLQFFDQSGRPLAFGCVFTYQTNTTTPLTTYTDYSGLTQNANPVILSAGGSANIWLQGGVAYAFRIKTYGGSNCASGSTLYTVNGIGGGGQILTTVVSGATPLFVVSAQNQLFKITLTGNTVSQPMTAIGIIPPGNITFQITQDSAGNHTFSWPSNTVGGCTVGTIANSTTTQAFVWNGSVGTAIGPCVTGAGPSIDTGALAVTGNMTATGGITATGNVQGTRLISTQTTGTAPLQVASTTVVPNLNVSQLEGQTWQAPNSIGGTTPNSAAFTSLHANTSLQIASATPFTGVQGTDVNVQSAGTNSGTTGAVLCNDASAGSTTSGCGQASKINWGKNTSPCTTTGADAGGGACTSIVNWNTSFADTNYYATCTGVTLSGAPRIMDINTLTTSSITVTIGNGSGAQATASTYASLVCIGVHP